VGELYYELPMRESFTVLAVLDVQKLFKVLRRSIPYCSKFQLNAVFSLKSCIYQPPRRGGGQSE
jgi:hypothetical protein